MPDAAPPYPPYDAVLAARLAARRAEALAAAREAAAAAAEAHGARLLVFGSLAGGPAASRFHARSDLDLAVWGEGLDDEALAEAASDAFHAAALRGFEADVVRLDRAPPALAERIRTHGRDPRDLR